MSTFQVPLLLYPAVIKSRRWPCLGTCKQRNDLSDIGKLWVEKHFNFIFSSQPSGGCKSSLPIHFIRRNNIKPLVGLDARFITWFVLTRGKWISRYVGHPVLCVTEWLCTATPLHQIIALEN